MSINSMFGAVILLIVALILAYFAKKYSVMALEKTDFDQRLMKWGLSKNEEESATFIDTIGTLLYFIIALFFVPFIFNGLGLAGVVDPI